MRLLKNLWPVCQSTKTDNIVFKLYYRYTVLILLCFSFVITCRLLFGYSFVCIGDNESRRMINSYCYTQALFVIPAELSKISGEKSTYPGIGHRQTPSANIVSVPYYPWVNLFLLVAAILFYLPHLIWKIFEGGLVKRLTSKINSSSVSETERKLAIIETAQYVITTRGGHLLYTAVYVTIEILNLVVGILLTIWLVNFFNASIYFGSDRFKTETWNDFAAYNFPLMGKCEYRKNGASGDVQRHNSLCHLPLNKLYLYMFLFLFAWFVLLCLCQTLTLSYRLLVLILPSLRLLLFRLRSGVTHQTLLTFLDTTFSAGDWFLLTRLQKNLLTHDLTRLLYYVQHNIEDKNRVDLEMNDIGKLI